MVRFHLGNYPLRTSDYDIGVNIPHPIAYKLAYSNRLLEILDSKIDAQLNEKSDAAIGEEYKDLSSFRAILQGKEVPTIIPLICGDVLQNIRSTLDYLVWELVIANKQKPDERNAFPVCIAQSTFKDSQKGRLRGVHPDAITIIESLQPYHLGQGKERESAIFVLDKLANIHKHRTILMAQERHAPVEMIRVVDPAGNVLGFDPLLAMDEKAVAEYIKAALEMKVNAQMVIFVQFGEGPAKGMEVISVVAGLYDSVALDIVPRFNRFFA